MFHTTNRLGVCLFCLLMLTGCIGALDGCGNSTIKMVDEYHIKEFASLPDIDGRNLFHCKLGYKDSPFVNHVKYAEWNDRLIKLITEEERCYIIRANREKLCCGCGDVVMGPMDKSAYEEELKRMGQTAALENVRHLER